MNPKQASCVTNGIRINVQTRYIVEDSSAQKRNYVFAYQVEIINETSYTVQLRSREWHIADAWGNKRVVKGSGVIGKQPYIGPGQSYRYVSGSNFRSPMGQMRGYYNMIRVLDQKTFRVTIPTFVMIAPHVLN